MTEPTKKVDDSFERPLLSADIPGGEPGEWDEGLPLRETFLMYFAEEPADFLRWLGKRYTSWMFENDLARDPSFRDSRAKAFLRAAMLDLRYSAQFLAALARSCQSLTPSEGCWRFSTSRPSPSSMV